MNLVPFLLVSAGMTACLAMLGYAVAGPGTGKRGRARLEKVKERFSQSETVRAQVQMKRILSRTDSRLDDVMKQFVPNPALLRQRLEKTGKSWTLGGYVAVRSEEHTSELQSLMRISYAVFCLKKQKNNRQENKHISLH